MEGIWILHDGIVKLESELLSKNEQPDFVSEDETSIKERMRLRFALVQHLYNFTGEDTFEKIGYVDLAENSRIGHQSNRA